MIKNDQETGTPALLRSQPAGEVAGEQGLAWKMNICPEMY